MSRDPVVPGTDGFAVPAGVSEGVDPEPATGSTRHDLLLTLL